MAPTYHYLAHDLANGTNKAELPVDSGKFGFVMNGAGKFSATLPLRSPQASRDVLIPARTAIHIYRNGQPVWGGILWGVQVDLTGDQERLVLDGSEYWSAFLQGSDTGRFIRHDLVYTAEDQLDIARSLVAYALDEVRHGPMMVLGISTSDTNVSGITRTRSFDSWDYKPVAEAILELAEIDDGFDFRVQLSGDLGDGLSKTFKTIFPRQSENVGHLAADNIKGVQSLSYHEDGLRMGRRFIIRGEGAGALGIEEETLLTGKPHIYRDFLRTYSDEDDSTRLQERADAASNRYGTPPKLPTITMANDVGGNQFVGAFYPGDFLDLDLDLGYTTIKDEFRVVAMDVEVGGAGDTEAISLTLNEDYDA